MCKVGIVANPASGRDIRRLVAQAWVVSNQEKAALTARLFRGLEVTGVKQVLFMPEPAGICQKAFQKLGKTSLQISPVNISITGEPKDSTLAATEMVKAGVRCIITLGGDGTNRAVFKGSGSETPLLPISTGTNNVFSEFQEGTTAGYAAGILATGKIKQKDACIQSKVLWLRNSSEVIDLALIDLAVSSQSFIGARAIWELNYLKELFLTRAQPWSIGLSAIGGVVKPIDSKTPQGLHLIFGSEGKKIVAPVAPGLFKEISITKVKKISLNEKQAINHNQPIALVFDGERDRLIKKNENLSVVLSNQGPLVIDIAQTAIAATKY